MVHQGLSRTALSFGDYSCWTVCRLVKRTQVWITNINKSNKTTFILGTFAIQEKPNTLLQNKPDGTVPFKFG